MPAAIHQRTYLCSGTLWEERFRSCLARDEEYVLEGYRYIELNPVRAAMAEHLGITSRGVVKT